MSLLLSKGTSALARRGPGRALPRIPTSTVSRRDWALRPICRTMEDGPHTRLMTLQAELDSLHKAIAVLNKIAAELDILTAMENVRQVALELLGCERVTLFLIFERRSELRAMIDQTEILRIQFGEGIAGLVAQTGGSMNLADVYAHPMFNKEVDRLTGFRTRSMLCMAVSDMTGKNVAVLQALNKASGPFSAADERNLKLFGTHLGNTLVKAKLHETAKREKERLQAIYTCFKLLSTAEEVGQMVVCATTALERQIIHGERVFFFLVDAPRGELWLHTHQAEPVRLRMGSAGGVVGMCAESKKPMSWTDFEDPSQDPALQRLAPLLLPARIKSVLVQPIHGTNNDRVLAVVLAINKREAEGTSDIFFEPFFTDADCDAMGLFAYEVGDLLSERSLELSLLSALSVVGHDGAHPNAARVEPGGAAAGGAGADAAGVSYGPAATTNSAASGDEDLIRSQLIQMYLPEYKKESTSAHSVFHRNSFSSANAAANQIRASLERKRSAHYKHDEVPGKRGSPRCRDTVSASGRLGLALAAAAARSSVWATARMQHAGRSDDEHVAAAALAAYASGDVPQPGGMAQSERGSDGSADLLPDLGNLRCASSTMAEHLSHRTGGLMTAPSAGAQPALLMRSGRCSSGRAASGPQSLLPPRAPPSAAAPHAYHTTGGARHAGPTSGPIGGFGRLMAPWRKPLRMPRAAGEGGVGPSQDGDDDDYDSNDSEGSSGDFNDRDHDQHDHHDHGCSPSTGRLLEEEDEGREGDSGEEERELGPGEAAEMGAAVTAAAAAAAAGMGRGVGPSSGPGQGQGQASLLRGLSWSRSRRRIAHLPAPLDAFLGVEGELREAAEASLHTGVADPQALRTHLSCSNLAQAGSPRAPCFYREEQLLSWDWDFTEFGVEELIKLSYDIFIVSGTMEEFAIRPKALRNFLTAVASHYHSIPYHNFNHVCHVLHATFLISSTTRARDVVKPLERLALLLAALCHDLDHDGHSNSFHVNSGSELARIYNDQSVMENHHCAMTFAILSRNDCNVLGGLQPEEQRAARKAIISAILCTDMANHFTLTQEFQKHVVGYDPDSESDRMLLMKVALHAADIGNAVRPFHVNHAMSRRVHREFEAQASEETRLGLPITFAVDTSDHVMCARVELNFLDYVVTTLWERLVDVLPELAPRLAMLRVNRARYRKIADTGKTADQVLGEEEQHETLTPGQPAEEAAAAASPAADAAAVVAAGNSCTSLKVTVAAAPAAAGPVEDTEAAALAEDMLLSPASSVPQQLPNGIDGSSAHDHVMSEGHSGLIHGGVVEANGGP